MPPQNFRDIVNIFVDLVNPLLVVIAGLALLAFIKGLTVFIAKSGDTKTHAEGRSLMIWGLIALFVMVSFWGLIQIVYGDLGFKRSLGFPTLPTSTEIKP